MNNTNCIVRSQEDHQAKFEGSYTECSIYITSQGLDMAVVIRYEYRVDNPHPLAGDTPPDLYIESPQEAYTCTCTCGCRNKHRSADSDWCRSCRLFGCA